MDAVIRSARLGSIRTRLSDAGRSDLTDTTPQSAQRPDARSAQEAWKGEVERQVRAEAASHARELYETERERGYADGYADGQAEGLTEAKCAVAKDLERTREQLAAQADKAISALERAHEAVLSMLQSSVGEVAFAAVCRLVSRKAVAQSLVLQVVEHACAQLRMDAVAIVRLHPRDIDAVTELIRNEAPRLQSLGLKLVRDESLQLGGCVVEAESGHYDGGLENQLRRLHAVLTDATATESTMAVERMQGGEG